MEQLTLDETVHLIQVALTPVFLLSGIAALMNVYSGRLARVSDRLDGLTAAGAVLTDETRTELRRLRLRSVALDVSVVLGTAAAACTCLAILALFLSQLSNKAIAGILLGFFGSAVVCTLASVAAFGIEMLLSNRGMRLRLHGHGARAGEARPG